MKWRVHKLGWWALIGGLMGGIVPARAVTVQLEADAERIPADGLSTVRITARVLDDRGRPVPDGQPVLFATTAGVLLTPEMGDTTGRQSVTVLTRSGAAQVSLRSTTEEVTADVTARLPDQPGEVFDVLSISFGSGTALRTEGSRLIRIEADYVVYFPELQLIEAVQNVMLTHRGITIETPGRLQLDLLEYRVIAKDLLGRVVVRSGGKELKGDALSYELVNLRGLLYSTRTTQGQRFQGVGLQVIEKQAALGAGIFDYLDTDKARMSIKARKITVYPREKIQFNRARFYFDQTHVLTLPYHFEPVTPYGGAGQFGRVGGLIDFISYSSQYGVLVNIPLYFHASERSTGALRIRRGGRAGYFLRNPGWSLELEEQYTLGEKGEGIFTIDQLTTKDFGFRLRHQQKFNQRTRGNLSLDWFRHRDFSGSAYLTARLRQGGYVNWQLWAYRYAGLDWIISSQAVWQLPPRRWRSLKSYYGLSFMLGYRRSPTWPAALRGGVSLDLRPSLVALGPQTVLNTRLGYQYNYDTRKQWDAAFNFSATVQHRLGRRGSLSLAYTLDQRRSTQYSFPMRQTLSLNVFTTHQRWSGYLFTSYDLDGHNVSLFGNARIYLTPQWGLNLQGVYQDYAFGDFFDAQIALERIIAGRTVRLGWWKARHKFYLELGEMYF